MKTGESSQQLFSIENLRITLTARNLAVLVGLRNLRIPVERLVCLDEINPENQAAILNLEKWLEKNRFPRLLFAVSGKTERPSSLCEHLLRTWNWSERECALVLKFEGLSGF